MTIIEELYQLNHLTPIAKFKLLDCHCSNSSLSEIILLALCVIDECIRELGNFDYSFYVQDDMSVKRLLSLSSGCDYNDEDFIKSMLLLDLSKLIYRFPCAKKFCMEDSQINQYRLNSWGFEYIFQENLRQKYSTLYQKIWETFYSTIQDQRDNYLELLILLRKYPLTPEAARRIQCLNSPLIVKLLS